MYAALHGRLGARSPWSWDADPFSLFYRRSSAMGWLRQPEQPEAAGLWDMHDAGWHGSEPGAPQSAFVWFQVGVPALAAGQSLPVHPFLRCADDVATAWGMSDLVAVQVLLPVQALVVRDPDVRSAPALTTAGWFAREPEPAVQVELTVELGERSRPQLLSSQWLAAAFDELDQGVLRVTPTAHGEYPPLALPFPDYFWGGPVTRRHGLVGRMRAWSVDEIGWVAALLAEICARGGVHEPVVVSVRRA